MTTLLDDLRANAATLPPDALLTRAAKAIEDAEAAREVMRRERNAAMNERDEAYAALRDYAPSCHQCGELGPSRVNRRAFGVPCVVDACDAHRGETYQEVKHAVALRAAAKAGE